MDLLLINLVNGRLDEIKKAVYFELYIVYALDLLLIDLVNGRLGEIKKAVYFQKRQVELNII